jgi:hypothetical protein
MRFRLRCRNRLTVRGSIAEDAEKTAVFLYSNVKHCRLCPGSLGTPLG